MSLSVRFLHIKEEPSTVLDVPLSSKKIATLLKTIRILSINLSLSSFDNVTKSVSSLVYVIKTNISKDVICICKEKRPVDHILVLFAS